MKYPPLRELLYVRSGKVKFTVLGQEFIADDECVVNIPRFAPHSLEALEHSEVYDLGGQTYWSLFFQSYAYIRTKEPERLTPETVEALKKKFQVQRQGAEEIPPVGHPTQAQPLQQDLFRSQEDHSRQMVSGFSPLKNGGVWKRPCTTM